MADPQEVLAERVSEAVTAAFGASHASADPLIRPSQFADFQANVALPLGKSLGMPPRQAAGQIVAHLDVAGTAYQGGANKGSTGRPTTLLADFLLHRAAR